MTKYLSLGDEPGEKRWTLADDVNVEELRKEISAAMDEGRTARVRVVVGKDLTAELIVNGRAVKAALLLETKPNEPTITIID